MFCQCTHMKAIDFFTVSRPTSRFFAAPVVEMDTKPKYLSVRDFFGKEEFCYIMDAKNAGNIGRYLNVRL